MAGKAAATEQDKLPSPCQPTIITLSPTVLIGNAKAAVAGLDGVNITQGSNRVFINGFPALRVGDPVKWVCPPPPVSVGSGNVIGTEPQPSVFFGD
ncbi:MAG: PAAR domain-containing protein [Thiofilum sp.]|uniref:PAAR domain-containing protein n=1 Tax=Thiofilum sp. TaxID=2212733 RepID=UPI0025FAE0C5|nr:PAAR domain-containing protein [Thiofilum sp.]MBK8454764.1 PAAR domain-containing protein [Thiofilum sp.]